MSGPAGPYAALGTLPMTALLMIFDDNPMIAAPAASSRQRAVVPFQPAFDTHISHTAFLRISIVYRLSQRHCILRSTSVFLHSTLQYV
jgi:hypothetical protein